MTRRQHDLSPTPSEVLRYFLVWLRGFHLDRERSKAADWAMVGLTLFALGAAIFSAWYLEQQVKDARQATNAAIKNFQMDERAWVELDGKPKVAQSRKVEGQAILGPSEQVVFAYDINFRNVGKTLAKNVVVYAGFYSSDLPFQDESKKIDAFVKGLPPKLNLAIMPPNVPVQVPRTEEVPNSVTDIRPKPSLAKKGIRITQLSGSYLVGLIVYQEEFQEKPHHLEFCFIPAESGELRPCEFSNKED
jgi:hypothetical protein